MVPPFCDTNVGTEVVWARNTIYAPLPLVQIFIEHDLIPRESWVYLYADMLAAGLQETFSQYYNGSS